MDPPPYKSSGSLRKTYKFRQRNNTNDDDVKSRLRRTAQMSQISWDLHKATFAAEQGSTEIDVGANKHKECDNDTIMADAQSKRSPTVETRPNVHAATPSLTSASLPPICSDDENMDLPRANKDHNTRLPSINESIALAPIDENVILPPIAFDGVSSNTMPRFSSFVPTTPRYLVVRAENDENLRQEVGRISLGAIDSSTTYTILKLVLLRDNVIKPFFQKGMRYGGFNSPSHETVQRENIDLTLFRVSKQFHKACSAIFYGGNYFVFIDPFSCDWWIQKLGAKTFGLVRHLHIEMRSGWLPTRGDRWDQSKNKSYYEAVSTFRSCDAEKWYGVLCWMQFRHELKSFMIVLDGWMPDTDTAYLPQDEKDEIVRFRGLIITKLKMFRGIEGPVVQRGRDRYLSPSERNDIEMLMKQPKSTVVKPEKKKVSLWEALATIEKENREKKEEEEVRALQETGHWGFGGGRSGKRVCFDH